MTSVILRQIGKRYGQNPPVLDGIDLTIEPGELFFLLGPSGCGKSTLLRILAGFLVPDAGSVHFGELDVTALPAEKRDAGMVFQNYALWPHMTVAANVAFGLEVRKVPAGARASRVREALAMVGLEHLAERPIPALSGGQQQRVALARALVIRPRLMLLDEPLSNLDAKLRLDMRTEIRRICKETGLTTIYVTHDQKEALSMADRMAVLHGGHIAQLGTPMEVYRRPISRFVADFIGESNFTPGTITSLSQGEAVVTTAWGELRSTTLAPGLAAGGRCLVCVRPEALRFATAASNNVTLTVADMLYLGELGQWTLTCGNDRLKAFELRPLPRQPGEQVTCSVEPVDVIVLPPDTATKRA